MHDALLITDHLAALGAAPALTAYTPDGRLEVSGRVALQWANKIVGLLRDELDAEEGDVLRVDLPPSWRAPLWTLGALLAGVTPRLPGTDGPDEAEHLPEDKATASGTADGPTAARETATNVTPAIATVTHVPDTVPDDAGTILALAEGSLAMRWTGELPRGGIDASSETLAQPDDMIFPPTPADGDPVLGAASAVGRDLPTGVREALVPTGTSDAVVAVLGAWLARGSAVLLAPGTDETESARLVEVERARLRPTR